MTIPQGIALGMLLLLVGAMTTCGLRAGEVNMTGLLPLVGAMTTYLHPGDVVCNL
jgi:hypothetical protein